MTQLIYARWAAFALLLTLIMPGTDLRAEERANRSAPSKSAASESSVKNRSFRDPRSTSARRVQSRTSVKASKPTTAPVGAGQTLSEPPQVRPLRTIANGRRSVATATAEADPEACQRIAEKFAILEAKRLNGRSRLQYEVRNVLRADIGNPTQAPAKGATQQNEPTEVYSLEVWENGSSFILFEVTMTVQGCHKVGIKQTEF